MFDRSRYGNLLVEMPSIIAKYRVLIYSGDFDAQIPHTGTEEWTRGLGAFLCLYSSILVCFRSTLVYVGSISRPKMDFSQQG